MKKSACEKKESIIKKTKSLVCQICLWTGLNTTTDYNGIENEEDIIFYLEAILEHIKKNRIKNANSSCDVSNK